MRALPSMRIKVQTCRKVTAHWLTFLRLRPIPDAARKSSLNSASCSSISKSQSLVRTLALAEVDPSRRRMFLTRRLVGVRKTRDKSNKMDLLEIALDFLLCRCSILRRVFVFAFGLFRRFFFAVVAALGVASFFFPCLPNSVCSFGWWLPRHTKSVVVLHL